MATGAQTWSTTAASNASADASVNWAEGQAPSSVNNSARAEMASAAMWIGDNSGVLLTSGTTAAYTVATKQVAGALTDGYTVACRMHATNDSAATLNVDGLGAKKIQRYAGTNVSSGDITIGSIQRLTYHTSSTAWVLQNYISVAATPIAFPASATISTDANTLDDYEEGTWTPSATFDGSTSSIGFTTRVGAYTKIGRLVAFQAEIRFSAIPASTGQVTFTGLPFANGATAAAVSFKQQTAGAVTEGGAWIEAGATAVSVGRDSGWGTTVNLALGGTYYTTS